MSNSGFLTSFQIDVAEAFFELEESAGFLMAGGAALLASNLIARPTLDLALFASAPVESVAAAQAALVRVLGDRGWSVAVLQSSDTFCRMVVSSGGDEVLVDLAMDSPPHTAPNITLLGPTLAPPELAGRKLLALFRRAEARDFADTYVLAHRFGKTLLIEQADQLDSGFDQDVLAQMMGTMGRFDDDEIPLSAQELTAAKAFFAEWAQELRRIE